MLLSSFSNASPKARGKAPRTMGQIARYTGADPKRSSARFAPDGQRASTTWVANSVGTVSVTR